LRSRLRSSTRFSPLPTPAKPRSSVIRLGIHHTPIQSVDISPINSTLTPWSRLETRSYSTWRHHDTAVATSGSGRSLIFARWCSAQRGQCLALVDLYQRTNHWTSGSFDSCRRRWRRSQVATLSRRRQIVADNDS
jgi:hypothetical protein